MLCILLPIPLLRIFDTGDAAHLQRLQFSLKYCFRHIVTRSTQPSIPPGSINEYQRRLKAGMAHSDCGWTCGCAGKTVRSLENTRHTWGLLRWWFTTKRRYIKCMHLYLWMHLTVTLPRLYEVAVKALPYLQLVLQWNAYSSVAIFMRPHRSRMTNKIRLTWCS